MTFLHFIYCLQLTSWPLDGVPTDSNTLLALRRKVRRGRKRLLGRTASSLCLRLRVCVSFSTLIQVTDCMAAGPAEGADGPTFVHCDLGLNRSGAFILLDIMMAKVALFSIEQEECARSWRVLLTLSDSFKL